LSLDAEMRASTLKNDHMKKTKNVYIYLYIFDRFGHPPPERAGTCTIEEYQYVNIKPLLPPISIQIQFEISPKKLCPLIALCQELT
jgi:hypothetical protein